MQEHGKKVGRIFDYNIQKYYLCTAIVLWCNGSTTVFGSVSGGSNPPGTTTIFTKPLKVKCFQGLYFLGDQVRFPVYGVL